MVGGALCVLFMSSCLMERRSSESVMKENLVDEADVDCVLVEMKAEEVLECVSLSGEGCFDPFAH